MMANTAEELLILGNPNSGKSLLFNKLTGLKQKVANFPGVTVEVKSAKLGELILRDFPGLYSLDPLTRDEGVAIDALEKSLKEKSTFAILYVLDSTRLERSLFLLLQVLNKAVTYNIPVIGALNIVDEIHKLKGTLNTAGLSQELGIPLVEVSAKKGIGIDSLKTLIKQTSTEKPPTLENKFLDPRAFKSAAKLLAKQFGPHAELMIRGQTRIDHIMLSPWSGFLIFVGLMFLLFQSVFSFSAPLMDLVSGGIEGLGAWVVSHLGSGVFSDFIKDAIFGGLASVFVFAPQIFVLFVIIGLLEDSGYMARAAILVHRPLQFFGLNGKSFVPLLSGQACAIPAIMATRTIESPKKRLITQIVTPLMTCSARLPVYSLLISAFIPNTRIFGFITLQGLSFFALYFLGLAMALIVSLILSKTLPPSIQDAPFLVELPPYRIPSFLSIFRHAIQRLFAFIKQAGTFIFAIVVLIWALGYFPNNGNLEDSYLAYFGQKIAFIFSPMGLDWKLSVALLASFLAREVFVGTVGTLWGIANADENTTSIIDQMHNSNVTLPTALSLLIFYALAMQCVSTLGVLKTETQSKKLPWAIFFGYSLFAYLAASFVFFLSKTYLG